MKYTRFIVPVVASIIGLGSIAYAFPFLTVPQGGTGVGTFTGGQLIYGNATNGLSSVATTTASCSGSTSCTAFTIIGSSPITISSTGASAAVATSTNEVAGFIPYWTTTGGTPARLGQVATSSLTASGVLSLSQPVKFIGSSDSALSVTGGSAGQVLSWSNGAATWVATTTDAVPNAITFNNGGAGGASGQTYDGSAAVTISYNTIGAQPTLTFTAPLFNTANTVTWYGLATTTALTGGQLLYSNGTNGVTGVATTTPSFSGPFVTSGLGSLVGGSSPTITWTGLATTTALTGGQLLYSNGTNGVTSIATSSESITGPFNIPATYGKLVGGSGSITYWGLATTTALTGGNLLYSNGTNGVVGVATSSETCTSPLSCTAHTVLTGGGAITLGTVTVDKGGTGVTSVIDGGLLYGAGGSTNLVALATTTGGVVSYSYTTGRPITIATSSLNISAAAGGSNGQFIYNNGGAQGGVTLSNASTSSGRISFGTSSPAYNNLLTLGTSTAPQLQLDDNSPSVDWDFRAVNGNLYIATSTPFINAGATSTIAALTILTSGTSTYTGLGWKTGLMGVASNTPFATFSVQADPAFTNASSTTVFAVGSTTIARAFSNLFQINNIGQALHSAGSAAKPALAFLADLATGIYQSVANTLSFVTNGVERMTIGATGAVSIGTTSAAGHLTVATTTGKNIVVTDTNAGAGFKHWLISSFGGNFYIGTTTDTYATSTAPALSILADGQVSARAVSPATSTTYQLDWKKTPNQVDFKIGTAATTITIINATNTAMWGSTKRIWICNPPSLSAGALTWQGLEWIGTAPTQTTTAGQCDIISCNVTSATSTLASPAYKVACNAGTGFK